MRWQATFDRLDKLSRKRALTDNESALLQHAIGELDASAEARATKPTRHGGWTDDEDARFFDLIADGLSISAAARAVGRSRNSGVSRFARAVREMGAQAR
jgi:hypothetical protein